jgi:hypothetical protein
MIARAGVKYFWFGLASGILVASTPVIAKSLDYPADNAEFYLQVSNDYKTKVNPDGSIIGIGLKEVIALTSMKDIKNKASAKSALPELAKKFFFQTLLFQEFQVQGIVDGKITREGGGNLAVMVLTASSKNSDGREIAITATTFASEQGHYFIFFTAARPEDNEDASKTSRTILGTMTAATNEED